jgi:tRNA modification GTPase
MEQSLTSLKELLETFESGRVAREGIKVVIVGKPNAGKSSIMNVLLGENRAIVTDIAGTTRDTLEESMNMDGILFNIIDTAGIRRTEDRIEQIGVERALSAVDQADLILYVIDGASGLDEDDQSIAETIRDKTVITLINKSDLPLTVS